MTPAPRPQLRHDGTVQRIDACAALDVRPRLARDLALVCVWAEDVRATIVQQKSGTQATLMGVYFRNAAVGWAVGAGGTLLKTVDAGRKWKKVPSGTSSLLTAVLFVDDRKGWAVGANGTVRSSKDGGETWGPQVVSSQAPLYGIFFVCTTRVDCRRCGYRIAYRGRRLDVERSDQRDQCCLGCGGFCGRSARDDCRHVGDDSFHARRRGDVDSTGELKSATFFDVFLTDESNAWAVGNAALLPDHGRRGPLDRPDAALWPYL